MKLRDYVFMVDLINTNYRRRMMYFWINMLVMVVSMSLIFINLYFNPDFNGLTAVYNYLLVSFIFVGLIRYWIMYLPFDGESNTPWDIKKRQMKALEEVFSAKAEFENLGHCVPLFEYFGK